MGWLEDKCFPSDLKPDTVFTFSNQYNYYCTGECVVWTKRWTLENSPQAVLPQEKPVQMRTRRNRAIKRSGGSRFTKSSGSTCSLNCWCFSQWESWFSDSNAHLLMIKKCVVYQSYTNRQTLAVLIHFLLLLLKTLLKGWSVVFFTYTANTRLQFGKVYQPPYLYPPPFMRPEIDELPGEEDIK